MKKLLASALSLVLLLSVLAVPALAFDSEAFWEQNGAALAAKGVTQYGEHEFRAGLMPVMVNEKWNYINERLEVVDLNKGRFDYVFPFYDGLAAVANGDGVGYIDKTGKLVIPCQYGTYSGMGEVWVGYFHEGKATVLKESYAMQQEMGANGFPSFSPGQWEVGKIDKAGKLVEAYHTVEGMSAGLYMIVDYGMTSDGGEEAEPEQDKTGINIERETVSDWAKDGVNAAYEAGLIPAVTGNPGYQEPITREQFAELAVQMVTILNGEAPNASGTAAFTDCDNPKVMAASAAGIVSGIGNGTFNPKATTNREQIAAMVARAIDYIRQQTGVNLAPAAASIEKFSDKGQVSAWAAESVGTLAANGIMTGTTATTLSPKDSCTVEQSILLVYRVYTNAANVPKNTEGGMQQDGTPYYSDLSAVPDFGALYGYSDKGARKAQSGIDYYEYVFDQLDDSLSDNYGTYIDVIDSEGFRWVAHDTGSNILLFRNSTYPEWSLGFQIVKATDGTIIRILKYDTPDAKPVSALCNYSDGPGNVPDFAAAVGWSLDKRIVVDESVGTVQYTYTGDNAELDARYLAWYDQLLNAGFSFGGTDGTYNLSQWYNDEKTWCVQEGPLPDGRYVVGIVRLIVS